MTQITQGTDLFKTLVGALPKSNAFQVSIDLPPRTALALFVGFLVTEQKVPEEIARALDAMEEKDIPDGWDMFVRGWQNRSDDAIEDVYQILGQIIKDAVKTS